MCSYPIKTGENKDIKFIEKAGKGVYGSVYKCNHTNYGVVALKKLNKEKKFEESTERELSILKSFKDNDKNHIINYLEEFKYDGFQYIVLEYINCNLYKYLKYIDIEFNKSIDIVKRILLGLDYLHKNNIIHADIKPENILYDEKRNYLKIIDYGNAQYIDSKKTNFYIQSRYYRAIEILFELDYNEKIDIWSLGCISYELLFKIPLYKCNSETILVSQVCDDIGIIELDLYKKSEYYKKYFVNYNSTNLLKIPHYYGMNTNIKGLETRLSLKLSRKIKYISHKIRNLYIDFMKSIIVYDFNNRPSAEDLLKNELFTNI